MLAQDRDLRVRLGCAARARALTWSWETVAHELYDVYCETSPARTVLAS